MIDTVIAKPLRGPVNRSAHRPIQWPAIALCGLLLGYMTVCRPFAHIGIAPLYIAEIVLLLLVLFRPDVVYTPWAARLFEDGRLTAMAYAAVLFVIYGLFQLFRGLLGPHPNMALQNFAFNVYVVFLFAGIWLGQHYPRIMQHVVYPLSWCVGIYGLLYLTVLADRGTEELVEASKSPFGQPGGCAIVMLALLAYESNWRRIAIPLLLNALVLIGNQVRAEWLGFTIAVTALSFLTGRFNKLFTATAILVGIMIVFIVTDFKIPAPSGRGGDISARAVAARALAVIDEDAAARLSPRAHSYASTISWRTGWWKAIYREVHQDHFSSVFGKGYSFAIWELHPEGITINRTPHNIAVFSLAYGGWVGVFVYYLFHGLLGACLWKVYRLNGQPFGICLWLAITAWSFFDNWLEAPFGAIPFYVLCGIQLAALVPIDCDADLDHPSPLSPEGTA
jgi:hypothetical protein